MLHRFDFMPTVSIIGPADDLLIVLQDLYEAFSFSEEYHEEYMQFMEAYLARICKERIYEKITAIKACEIIQPGKDREKR